MRVDFRFQAGVGIKVKKKLFSYLALEHTGEWR